jgi:hypothetical protein
MLTLNRIIERSEWTPHEFHVILECLRNKLVVGFYTQHEVIHGLEINRIALSLFDYVIRCNDLPIQQNPNAKRILAENFPSEVAHFRKHFSKNQSDV